MNVIKIFNLSSAVNKMVASVVFYVFLVVAGLVSASCPDISGSFFIDQLDLYPESADFDPKACKLYLR